MKILLVDDSLLVREFISDLLRASGWQVKAAAGLGDALQEDMQTRPDVVLADCILEGGSTGLQVIQAILAARAQTGVLPPHVALMTVGQIPEADRSTAAALGARVFQKPEFGREKAFIDELSSFCSS